MKALPLAAALVVGLIGQDAYGNPVDAERPVGETPGWSGSVDGRAALAVGNIDRVDLGGSLGLHWQSFQPAPERSSADAPPWLRQRWTLLADGALATLGSRRFVQRSFVHGRSTTMVWPRVGFDAFAQAQADAFTRLQMRLVAGAGVRVVALARSRAQVWSGAAYMPEFERNDILPGDVHPAATVNHRLSAYASFAGRPLAEGSLTVRATGYVQPRLDDGTDLRTLGHVALEAAAAPRLAVGFEGLVVHDTRPPGGVAHTDLLVRGFLRVRVGS